jgi:hypothetical protein
LPSSDTASEIWKRYPASFIVSKASADEEASVTA